jgi:hypothetical protein
VQIVFNKPVAGLDLADLTLTRSGGANLLGGGQTVTTTDYITWTLAGLAGITGPAGTYTLTLTAAGSGIVDPFSQPLAGNAADSWVVDTTPPNVDIVDVAPDPRNSAVGSIQIVFSEAVAGFDLADLSLRRNGGANLLTGGQTLATSDNVTWTLSGLTGITAAAGAYTLTLTAAGSGVADAAGNLLAATASDAWTTDTTVPTADIVDVSPDPRITAVSTISIVFSRAVAGLDLADLTLTRDGGANLLGGGQGVSTTDNITWTLTGLSGITATGGAYVLTLTAAGSGIADAVGNLLAANATDAWTIDTTAPTADIVDVQPDPRDTEVSQVTIVFSEPVVGLDLADLSLTRNGGGNLLKGTETLTTTDNITWVLGGLSGITGATGLTFSAYNDHVKGAASNANATNYASNGTPNGLLKNIATGANTGVTLVTSNSGGSFISTGGVATIPAGTDAYNYFNGYVNFASGTNSGIRVAGANQSYTFTFSGLDTGHADLYDFVGTALQAIGGSNSWIKITLNGADSFTAAHSADPNHTGVITSAYNSALGANQVAICTGANGSAAGLGYVAHWTNIDPGSDGTFTIVCTQYRDIVPGGTANGNYGYALTGIRLQEISTGPTLGAYNLALTAAGSGIHDAVGNNMAVNASDSWTIASNVVPTADVVDVSPDPRTTPINSVQIVFNEAVTGLDLADLSLKRDGGANLLTGSQTLTTTDNITWTLGNLAGLTTAIGAYNLTLTAAGSGIIDVWSNALAGDASDAWTIAQPAPAVVDFTPNGGLDRPDKLTDLAVGFSQDVSSSLDLGDLSIHNDSTGASVNLTGATVTYDAATNTAHWNLAPLALGPGYYTVRLSCQGVTNSWGQPLGGSGGQDYVQTMMVALPGDANLDGMVGDADLSAVETNFGRQSAPWSAGDFDHDGAVGYWDYLAVKANCGRQLSGAPSSPLSSEPAVAPTSTDTPADSTPADDATQTEAPAAAPTPTEDVELVPAAEPAAVQAPALPTDAGLGGASSWAGLGGGQDTVSVLSSAAAIPAAVRPAAVVVGGAADREPPAFATVRIVSAIPAVRPARSAALSWRSAMTDLLAGLPVEPSRPMALGTRLPDALAGARLAVPLE